MRIGASTANWYPMATEDALTVLLDAGFQTIEIFLNTMSETAPSFVKNMKKAANDAGASIVSVHSCSSFAEPHHLFSRYERRFTDALDTYRREFEAAAALGASYLIIHGDTANDPSLPAEAFAERYEALYDVGAACGVTLLQENVVHYRAGSPEFVHTMRQLLGKKAQFALDLKQCRRTGIDAADMLTAMGDALRHLHISDGAPGRDCLPPGTGSFDFSGLFSRLKTDGYTGDAVVELYRHNFEKTEDLQKSMAFLYNFL